MSDSGNSSFDGMLFIEKKDLDDDIKVSSFAIFVRIINSNQLF